MAVLLNKNLSAELPSFILLHDSVLPVIESKTQSKRKITQNSDALLTPMIINAKISDDLSMSWGKAGGITDYNSMQKDKKPA